MAKIDDLYATYGERIHEQLDIQRLAKGGDDVAKDLGASIEFNRFAERVDPTHNRTNRAYKFLDWACRVYLDKPVQTEDLYKIGEDLRDFESWAQILRADGHAHEIQKYASLAALRQVLQPYQDKRDQKHALAKRLHMAAEEKARIMAQTTVVYNGPEGSIVIPHTRDASNHWGNQTKWCISAGVYQSHFDSYNAADPIFMFLPRVPEAEKPLWQGYQSFKFASVRRSLWNERDTTTFESVPQALKELAKAAEVSLNDEALAFYQGHVRLESLYQMPVAPSSAGRVAVWSSAVPKAWSDPRFEADYQIIYERYKDENDWKATDYANYPELHGNRDLFLYTAKRGNPYFCMESMPAEYWNDPEILQVIGQHDVIEFAPAFLRDDRAFVTKMVQAHSGAFEHVSDRLKADRNFVKFAIECSGYNLRHAHWSMQADADLAKMALAKEPSVYNSIFPAHDYKKWKLTNLFNFYVQPIIRMRSNLKNDDSVLASMKYISGIEYASRRIRSRRDVMESQIHYNYKDATWRLRIQPDFARAAVHSRSENFNHVPWPLRFNRKFILEMAKDHPEIFAYVPNRLIRDRDFVLQAVRTNGLVYRHMYIGRFFRNHDEIYAKDREIALEAVKSNGMALFHINTKMCDREICMEAVKSDGLALQYLPKKFKYNREFVDAAITQNPLALQYIEDREGVFSFPEDIALQRDLVRRDAKVFGYITGRAQQDRDTLINLMIGHPKTFLAHMRKNDPRYLPDFAFAAEALRRYRAEDRQTDITDVLRHVPVLWGRIDGFTNLDTAQTLLDRAVAVHQREIKTHRIGLAAA